MAEINNSLALGIKNDAPDIGKTLLTAGQINEMRAKTALEEASTAQTQQNVDYNNFQQGQNGGYRAGEVNTLAEAHTKQLGVAGQIGNMLATDQSVASRKQALQTAKDSGVKIDPEVEKHILAAPAATVKQYGQNMQKAGQNSTANIEQSPGGIAQRSYMGAAGSTAGPVGGDLPPTPSVPPMSQPQVDSAISSRKNANGTPRVLSLEGNVPDQPGAPKANPLRQKGLTEAANAETHGNAQKNVEEFAGYKQAAMNSSTTKTVLHSLQDDADRVYTGKGAVNKGDAQKWILASSSLPGVGPLIKHFAGDQSDPVAAIENIRKNIGIISRTAVGDIGERSAAALDNVQSSLPSEEMSSKGLKLATSQMMAIEDFKQARLQQADAWQKAHGTLNGFAADWSKNMGPETFVMARLPKEEQLAVRERLNKTPEGKRTIEGIDRQLAWGAKHGLDAVID